MNTLYRLATTKGIDPKARTITAWASRADVVDRDGELITAEAWQHPDSTAAFEKNSVLMAFHRYDALPLGKVIALDKSRLGLAFTAVFAKTAAATEAFNFIEEMGGMASFSVGFIPRSSREVGVKELADKGVDVSAAKGDRVKVFDHVELIEISLAPIPSNPKATVLGAAFLEGKVKGAELKQILEPWGREVSEEDVNQALRRVDFDGMVRTAIKEKLPRALADMTNEKYRRAIAEAIVEADLELRKKAREEEERRIKLAQFEKADLNDPETLRAVIMTKLEGIDFSKMISEQVALAIDKHRGRVR